MRLPSLVTFSAVLLLAACGGSSPSGPSTSTVGSVALSPGSVTIAVGATTTLTAAVRNSAGTAMTGEVLTWTTANPAIATVAGGVVTAVAPGQAVITATSGNGKAGSATVKVLGPPASVTITRSSSFLVVGDTLQPGAVVKDGNGNVLSGTTVTWSTTGGTATVAGSVLTATAPGAAQLIATAGSVTGSASLTIWAGGGARDPLLSSIDSVVMAQMVRLGVPGGSVSITRNGKLVLSRAYGWADSATKRPAATDQLWRIGSVSKPITAVATMKLVEGNLLALTDKPFTLLTGVDLLPGQTQDARLPNVTVKNLLEHSGGWNTNRNVDDAMYVTMLADGNTDPKKLIRNGRGVALAAAPGTQFAYTNYEYVLLGRMIERASGSSYENYVKTSILAPAGITDMKLGYSPLNHRDPKEVSYYPVNEVFTTFLGTGTRPDVGGGQEYSEASGQWLASSLDMVKFLGAIDGNTVRADVVSQATMGMMMAQNLTVWPTPGYHYGFGFVVTPSASGSDLSHAGGQDGGDAYIARRADGINVAVLFNLTRGANTAEDAINAALDRIVAWPAGTVF